MFTHFFHFNVHLARDFQIEIFMQFGALLVAEVPIAICAILNAFLAYM